MTCQCNACGREAVGKFDVLLPDAPFGYSGVNLCGVHAAVSHWRVPAQDAAEPWRLGGGVVMRMVVTKCSEPVGDGS